MQSLRRCLPKLRCPLGSQAGKVRRQGRRQQLPSTARAGPPACRYSCPSPHVFGAVASFRDSTAQYYLAISSNSLPRPPVTAPPTAPPSPPASAPGPAAITSERASVNSYQLMVLLHVISPPGHVRVVRHSYKRSMELTIISAGVPDICPQPPKSGSGAWSVPSIETR